MIELGLQRISRLLAKTSLPWRAIHVAGTNGKGSICAYVSSMLETYNKSEYRRSTDCSVLKHARFTSPHLIDRWDCITINQQTVPFKLFSHVEQTILLRNEQEGIKASKFELLTATAFEIFTHEAVDVAVVEVGMGGRLDATNVIGQVDDPSQAETHDGKAFRPPPLVTAISKIGLDHQAFLGNTLGDIAREKAAIIKPGVPVVYDYSNDDEVKTTLEAQAASNRVVKFTDLTMPLHSLEDAVKRVFLPDEIEYDTLAPAAASRVPDHTRRNLSVAFRATWTALQELKRVPFYDGSLLNRERLKIWRLAKSMLASATKDVKFPGRLQNLSLKSVTGREQAVLLDGAHNAQSAEVLAAEVSRRRWWRPRLSMDTKGTWIPAAEFKRRLKKRPRQPLDTTVTWVLAFSSTKDATEILRILLRLEDRVFAVEFGPVDGMPWVKPLSSEKIADAVDGIFEESKTADAHACGTDLLSALKLASEGAKGGTMVIAGSLYLVGDVLRLLRDHEGHTD